MATILEQTIKHLQLLASNKRKIHFQTLEIQQAVSIANLANVAANDPAFTESGLTKQELITLYTLLSNDVAEMQANNSALLALILKADAARNKE